MIIKRLLKFLEYNERQYTTQRAQQNYVEAARRLERLSKIVVLIHRLSPHHQLHPDDAIKIFGIQRHLKALGFHTEEPPPFLYHQAVNYLRNI